MRRAVLAVAATLVAVLPAACVASSASPAVSRRPHPSPSPSASPSASPSPSPSASRSPRPSPGPAPRPVTLVLTLACRGVVATITSAIDRTVDVAWTGDTTSNGFAAGDVDLAAGVPTAVPVSVTIFDKQVTVGVFPAGSGGFAGTVDPLAEGVAIIRC